MGRRLEFNETYFESIDTEDKAYFLGFIYADGSLIKGRNNVVLKIHTKDLHILESLIKCVDGKMNVYKSKTREICQVGLTSKKMRIDLEKIGLHSNKTFTIKYPNIDIELERHFLRGYFDGDGCIRVRTDKRDGTELGDMRFVSGSIDMLNTINERMNILFGTNKNKLYGPKNKDYKFLGWASMKDIESIYHGFYNNSNFFLHRKKETFDNVINIINNKKSYRKK